MKIDIGDLCTHCGRDTSFQSGNGLFVNRIPSETDEQSGYMCPDCQYNDLDYCVECDNCSELTLEYDSIDQDTPVICPDCIAKEGESMEQHA
jgi:DNA-directed RNA polymerase subunit RPC12/RpoP